LRDHAGGYELAGWLDREAGEILRSALSPLAALPRATDVEVGVRTATQRDADALVDLAARALRTWRWLTRHSSSRGWHSTTRVR
jgi:hypothetical protein